MKPAYNARARERSVNSMLNEDLAEQARSVAGNLSHAVEEGLADSPRLETARITGATTAAWNRFGEEHGSFADEYSVL